MLRKMVLLGMLLVMVSVVSAQAAMLEKIEVTLAWGGNTIFDASAPASTSQLTWQGGSGAIVFDDTGGTFTGDDSDIAASFSTVTDNSGGGDAAAGFTSGTWNLDIRDFTEGDLLDDYVVLSVGGTLDWYNEWETGEDELTGIGIVTPTSFWVKDGHSFLGSATWGDGGTGKSGIQAQTSGLSIDPVDYATDFTGDSLTLVIFAHPSSIPEPVTMVLLGLGALGMLRRRR